MPRGIVPALVLIVVDGSLIRQTRVVIGEHIPIGQPGPDYPSMSHPILAKHDVLPVIFLALLFAQVFASD